MSCPDCFKGAVHDHGGDAQGTMQTLHGYPCYVASASAPAKSKSTIIFFCDAFGLNLINSKLLCDKYAAETGFRVIAPDVIPGGPVPVSAMAKMESAMGKKVAWWDIRGQLKRAFMFVRAMSIFVPFLLFSRPVKAFPSCLKFARSVRAELPPEAKLGVAGFCWGGYPSTNLCKEPAVKGGKERLVDAQFCAHPSFLSTPRMVADAINTFHTAYSMAIGDKDFAYPEKKVLDTQAALRERVGDPEENDYEIRIYKGCSHGFSVRARPGNKVEMAAMEEAREQAVNWFKKYL